MALRKAKKEKEEMMGAKSTITISRSKAMSFIEEFLYNASNEVLASLVESLNDEVDASNSLGLHNFQVVDHPCSGSDSVICQ